MVSLESLEFVVRGTTVCEVCLRHVENDVIDGELLAFEGSGVQRRVARRHLRLFHTLRSFRHSSKPHSCPRKVGKLSHQQTITQYYLYIVFNNLKYLNTLMCFYMLFDCLGMHTNCTTFQEKQGMSNASGQPHNGVIRSFSRWSNTCNGHAPVTTTLKMFTYMRGVR